MADWTGIEMRYMILALMSLFIATPAFAGTGICKIDGPHNCMESSEDQLLNITKNTIHQMELTHEHVFKTQNDTILETAAREHVELNTAAQADRYLFLNK